MIVELTPQGKPFLVVLARAGEIAGPEGDRSGHAERLSPDPRQHVTVVRQRFLDPATPFGETPVHLAEHAHCAGEPERRLDVSRVERPAASRADVVELVADPVEPFDLISAREPVRLGSLGELHHPVGEAAPDVAAVKAVGGEAAHRRAS